MGYEIKKFNFNIKELQSLNFKFDKGLDFFIYSVSTSSNPKDNTLLFCNTILNDKQIESLSNLNQCLIILKTGTALISSKKNLVLYSDNPRREYAIILEHILKLNSKDKNYTISPSRYSIGKNVSIGENVIIEPFIFIDDNVTIGKNVVIKSGAKIRSNVTIGDNCILKENCVIGSSGFGVEREDDGTTYKIPHLGGVEIGSNVEVGALTSIASGTIEPTVIEDYVKIDDCVFIAHNCHIGKGSFVIANAEVSGSVNIGQRAWIGPSSSIIQKKSIGDDSLIGIGAVVTRDVNEGEIVAGNPADSIENLRIMRRKLRDL